MLSGRQVVGTRRAIAATGTGQAVGRLARVPDRAALESIVYVLRSGTP
jgi:hypothetical protein